MSLLSWKELERDESRKEEEYPVQICSCGKSYEEGEIVPAVHIQLFRLRGIGSMTTCQHRGDSMRSSSNLIINYDNL